MLLILCSLFLIVLFVILIISSSIEFEIEKIYINTITNKKRI